MRAVVEYIDTYIHTILLQLTVYEKCPKKVQETYLKGFLGLEIPVNREGSSVLDPHLKVRLESDYKEHLSLWRTCTVLHYTAS